MAEKGHKSWCRHVKGAGFGAYDNSCNCGDPYPESKAITRYRLCNDVYVDRYEHGIVQPCWDALKNQTDVVLVRDHEAALDTLKLALQLECEKNAAKDARIAELEAEYDESVSDYNELVRQLLFLRTAIEAKAQNWSARAENATAEQRDMLRICAAELRALVKP